MDMVRLIETHKVYPTAKGPMHAVRGVSLDCPKGEILAVLGPSGSGKSSLMRMIAGLEQVSAGQIMIAGENVNDVPAQSRNVSLAFENYALYPALTVRENLGFPLRNFKQFSKPEITALIDETAEYLNLGDVLDKKPTELSGGYRQMVSLGRALIKPADLHILDEPLSHLDLQFRNRVVAKLKTLQKERNLTMILITHDQEEALEMADRVAVINDGLLQQIDAPVNVVERPANVFVADFVGEPPMNFIPCRIEGGTKLRILAGNGSPIAFPQTIESSLVNKQMLLGVRPADLFVMNGAQSPFYFEEPAKLIFEEHLGEFSVLNISMLGQLLRVVQRRRESRPVVGDKLQIGFKPGKLHFFDKITGLRVPSMDTKTNGKPKIDIREKRVSTQTG